MNKHSRVCANIDLSAIMHNMEAMHQNIDPNTKIMAVIKADGYGHGAVPIAKEIEHLDYVYGYAAATVEEGMILRNNGIQKPILILGYIFPDQYEEVIQAEICPSVFTLEMAEELSAAAEKVGKDCRMHFAVDTGMSRIGYQVTEEAADEMAQIAKLPHIEEVQELLVDGLVFIWGLGGGVFGAAVAVCRRLLFCWYLPHWLSCILSGIFRILWLYKPYSLKPILLHRIRVFLPVNFL